MTQKINFKIRVIHRIWLNSKDFLEQKKVLKLFTTFNKFNY